MRLYETVVILKPDTADAAVKTLAKKVEKVLEAKPGDVLKKDDWGAKKLAYEIKGEKKGRYLFWSYAQDPKSLGQLDRALRFDESVIRYMTVVIGEHGKMKEPPAKKIEKPRKVVDGRENERERDQMGPIRIDYKDVMTLAPFLSERGKIAPQRQNRLTAKEQRFLAQSIKRARQLALLSYNMSLPGREAQTMETGGML